MTKKHNQQQNNKIPKPEAEKQKTKNTLQLQDEENLTTANTIIERDINDELRESFLDYAMSVIISRAIPDSRDGLKPVQRRILYSMKTLGLTSDAKTRKSATIVGETLGHYHPHGDIAVYDALVRMAQDFSLRMPLVKGQGNFGCFTGDTKVALVDGRNLNFKDLIKEQKLGKKHLTYTFNLKKNKIEITEILKPRLTRKNAKLIEITLDNNEKIKCTLNHKFLMRNGQYKEAQLLKTGDSLMPLYIDNYNWQNRDFKNSKRIWQPITHQWEFIQQLADNWQLVTKNKYHKDFDKWNGVLTINNIFKHFDRLEQIPTETKKYNHKVIQIKILKTKEDVYDITTKPWHNFALASGVFVHNSIDGDPPAAQRYTEAKLASISDYLFEDIDKDTVNFIPNFDGTCTEPAVLPARFPQLLINGTTGIAVSMATNIAPHNISEVMDAVAYLINYPDAGVEDLMKFIKGPDFPTGGIIYGIENIKTAYATGKGKVLIRGKTEIVENNKKTQIIITEIPYMVNKSEMIKHIANLVENKKIIGIKDLRDESDKEGLRITIDLKSDIRPQSVLNQLYKYTELEKYFYINQIALTDNGLQPRLLTLKDLLEDFINHRKEVVLRRTRFLLKKYKDRLHILEGLSTALDNIDAIIQIIKKSENREDALNNLCKAFKFTEVQANAILEIKLQTLAKLEKYKINEEIKEKQGLIKECQLILKDEKELFLVIQNEIKEIKEKFVERRRTEIVGHLPEEVSSIDLIPEENVLITLSKSGYIKRMNPDILRTQQRGGKGVIAFEGQNSEDFLAKIISANTKDYLLFFTDKGKVYQSLVYDINESSRSAKGKAIQNFINIDPSETITAVLSYNPQKTGNHRFLIMATKNGIIKKTKIDEFANIRKTGLVAINLEKNDILQWTSFSSGDDYVILVTQNGQSICMSEKDIRAMGRATSGVCGIKLNKDDFVIGLNIVPAKIDKNTSTLLTVSEMGYGKRTLIKEYRIQKRGGTGIKTFKVTDRTKKLVASRLITTQTTLITISKKGLILKTELADVSIQGRTTQGVKLMRLDPGDTISEIETF